MTQPPVSYEVQDELGIIRIDNPPVNALSHAVRASLAEALETACDDDSKAVLLLCKGRTFIAGADISEFGRPPQPPHLPDIIRALENHPKPTIAALHGNALGGGLEVAMAAHYRCAMPGTKLGLPEVNLGILPGAGGTQRLPRLIGVEAALEMMTSGQPGTAEELAEKGLLDQLLDGDLEQDAIAYARELVAQGAPVRPTGERTAEAPQDPEYFDKFRQGIARKTRGQLAPGFIVELAELATKVDIEEGQPIERERFIECRDSPQSSAMRHVFFAQRATSKLPDIPADTPTLPVQKVAVIGAGTMGGGIAMCFANAGIEVKMVETSEEFLSKGMDTIAKNYAMSLQRGRFTQARVDEIMDCFSGTTDYADLADADLVIEAVFENMAVKKEVFEKLDASCKPECILATNTSYLDVNEIANATGRPEKVIGAHFFSPANVMKLLEVVRADKTDPEVVKTFMQLARTIGKIPVAVGVCHGFVGNRMLKGYARQAQLLLLEGASPQQIDSALEKWGMAMGPIAVGDLAGIDIGYRSRRDQGIEPRSQKESALADTLVEMERLGQKSGAGYYRYDPETRRREPDPKVDALIEQVAATWNVERREIEDGEIIQRLVLPLINEGAAILREGIAARPSDIDIVYLNGYGFPAFKGGPMYHADEVGIDRVLAALEKYRVQTGDECWEPDPLLLELAEKSAKLSSLNV
jgi:3-hydroxyacyl-CoA dehydrogenase